MCLFREECYVLGNLMETDLVNANSGKNKRTLWPLVRKRTVPTDRTIILGNLIKTILFSLFYEYDYNLDNFRNGLRSNLCHEELCLVAYDTAQFNM
jgi:hypothetical protein